MRTLTFGFTISGVAAFEATETARSTAMAAEDDAEMFSATARKAADAADENPITVAWDAANDAQRQEFVKLRGVEIGQADPFGVPTSCGARHEREPDTQAGRASLEERGADLYETPVVAVEALLRVENPSRTFCGSRPAAAVPSSRRCGGRT